MGHEIQQTRYDQLARRVGGIIGPGSKVAELLPELFPVLEVENTTPELLALSGWRTAWQVTVRASGVGNAATSQLFNPVDSAHLVVVTQIVIRVNATSDIDVETNAVVLAAGTSGLFRDTRFGIPRRTIAIASSLDGGATGGGPRFFVAADTPFTLRDDNGLVVLAPGTGMQVGTVATNLLLNVTWFWRERVAEPSELTFP